MPRDLPDWGALTSQATVHEVTDQGELAVRLGSIVTHDRRGDVIWLDSFESGLEKWVETKSGTGAKIGLSSATARNGRYSALLTGGSSGTGLAEIRHNMSFPVLSVMGFEVSFKLVTLITDIEFAILIDDGSDIVGGTIRWRQVENDLQYTDSNGDWITFATGIDLATTAALFYTVKLVIDAANDEYVRVIFNNIEYSLADIALQKSAVTVAKQMQLYVALTSRSGNNDQCNVDDAIVTQNEPT